MHQIWRRSKPLAHLLGVLAGTYAVFHLGLYFWLNSPKVAQERMDRGNEQIVEQVRAIYAANEWPGIPTPSTFAAAAGDGEPMPGVQAEAIALAPDRGEPSTDCFCPDDAP